MTPDKRVEEIKGALNRHYDFFICGEAYPKESEFKKVLLQDIETVLTQHHQDLIQEERDRAVQIIKDELQNAPLEVQMTKGIVFAKIIKRIDQLTK